MQHNEQTSRTLGQENVDSRPNEEHMENVIKDFLFKAKEYLFGRSRHDLRQE